jgi:hypothetical protein
VFLSCENVGRQCHDSTLKILGPPFESLTQKVTLAGAPSTSTMYSATETTPRHTASRFEGNNEHWARNIEFSKGGLMIVP